MTASFNFRSAFPTFPADSVPALPQGFVDCSFANDACPSFVNERLGLHLFVDWPHPADREVQIGGRFVVNRIDENGNLGDEDLLVTDDWALVEKFVASKT